MNEKLAIQKGLIINGNKDIYISIQNIYKYFFEKYLTTKINMSNYNNLIKTSKLYFGIPHPRTCELVTNLNEYFGFEHIYMLNNFFVEKLDIEQIKLLMDSSNNNFEFNEKIKDLVENTYKEVLKKNFLKDQYTNKRYKVCYGDVIDSNFAYNDELVLKIIYSRNTKEMEESEYIQNLKEKKEFLKDLIKLIKNDILDKMGIGCTVLVEKVSK